MKSYEQAGPGHQDAALLDHVERLARHREGRHALHLHLSKLSPRNRRPERLRVAALAFEPLLNAFEGHVFRLHNEDLVVLCKGVGAKELSEPVARLRELFARDPLNAPDPEGKPSRLCSSYDLAKNYDGLVDLARVMANAALQAPSDADQAAAQAAADAENPAIDPVKLAAVEKAIAQADLTGMIRRQAVCAITPGLPPKPVFYEVFTSINALREVVIPDVNIHGNRWLFQDLTNHLDRRVISYLARNDDSTLSRAFSINLNVASLLTPEFLKFDQALSSAVRRTIVIEVQAVDVLGDLDGFLFARDFLRGRGYRFCLDGLTSLSAPLVDCKRLGVDLAKIQWSAELHAEATGDKDQTQKQWIERFGADRVILIHCDKDLAFETGKALGVSLYQGFLIERLLKDGAGRPRQARAAG
jgi:EAL domain-containing protein (putative c-di-GMP-specific phosphodiesterase class I)